MTLTDESGLPVSARTEVYGNPAAYYIGVKPDAWSGAAGASIGLQRADHRLGGQPLPGQALTRGFPAGGICARRPASRPAL